MWRNVDVDLSDEPRVGCGMRLNLSTRAGMRPHLALLASIHPPPSVPQDDAPGTQASEAGWPGEAEGRWKHLPEHRLSLWRQREPVDVSRGNGQEDTSAAGLRRLDTIPSV